MLDFFNFFAFYWDLVVGLRWYWGVGWQVRRTVENAVDSHVTRDEDGHMSQLIDRPHQIAMSGPGGTSERQGAEVT